LRKSCVSPNPSLCKNMTKSSHISLSTPEKIAFLGNLSTMLAAGIPIVEVISSLLEDTKGHQREILQALHDDLLQGKRLSDTFVNFPRVFDRVTVNLIRASEEAGTLETTLKDIKDHIQKDMEFSDKIKFAMIYPGLILTLFLGVLMVILIVVIPKISTVFKSLKIALPLPTRILIFASDIILKQTWYLLGVLGAFVLTLFLLFRYKSRSVQNLLFNLPLISGLVKEVDFTRFSRSMHLLLSSGIPITTALDLSQAVVLSAKTAKIIAKSREMVTSGKRLSEGFRLAKGYMPTMMVKLIESGEKSGGLEKAMGDIAAFLDYRVTNALKAITAIIEPMLLVVVGISVGGMMLAIIAPIYGLISQVGSR